MVTTDNLKSYFEKARRFDQDRMIQVERSNRVAWSIAIAAGIVAGISILAVASLAPLKTVEPFVVRVDNSTGIVDVVSALSATAGTYDEAVTKYFAAKYVRGREGYVWSEAQENFRTIALSLRKPNRRGSQLLIVAAIRNHHKMSMAVLPRCGLTSSPSRSSIKTWCRYATCVA